MDNYPEELQVRDRRGEWDKKESVQLAAIGSRPLVPGMTHHDFKAEVTTAIQQKAEEKLKEILANLGNEGAWKDLRPIFVRAAIGAKHLPAIKILLSTGEETLNLQSAESGQWLHESVKKEFYEGIDHFLSLGVNINFRSEETGGNTPLHTAARRSDMKMMSYLVKKGADPSVSNTSGRTALQLIAIRDFSAGDDSLLRNEREGLDFSKFLNNQNLSDLTVRNPSPSPSILLFTGSLIPFFLPFSSLLLES